MRMRRNWREKRGGGNREEGKPLVRRSKWRDGEGIVNVRGVDRCKTTSCGERLWTLGTWNIISLRGKEIELISEFLTIDLNILGITE